MSNDEEVAYAAVAAVAQAKMGQYSPLLHEDRESGDGIDGDAAEAVERPAIGADARVVARMLVSEEKSVLTDLKVQLMGAVS